MVNPLQSVQSRMQEIRNTANVMRQTAKPEFVSEFQQKLNASMNENTQSNVSKTARSHGYHPFIHTEKTQSVPEKIDQVTDKKLTKSEQKQLIDKTISEASRKYDISEPVIRSVINQESRFDPHAVSRAGAMGLMQLMPKTALEMGVSKPFDIEENINGGVKYLKMMLDRYNGDLSLALAAYNAGPDRVDSAKGIPNIAETQDYVKKISTMLSNQE